MESAHPTSPDAHDREHESETRFRVLAELVPDAVLVNLDGRFVFANAAAARVLRAASADALIGRPVQDLVVADDLQTVRTRIAAVLERGGTNELALIRFRRADGSVVHVETSAGRVAWNGAPAVQVVFRDATARREEEATLRVREERQRFLLALGDRLRPLSDTGSVQREAAIALGTHLGAQRVGYAEIDREMSIVTANYTDGVRGIEGRYRVADFNAALLDALRAGHAVTRSDIAADMSLTDDERRAHAGIDVGATLDLPLLKDGELVAVLFVHFRQPHAFTGEEIALAEAVIERTWDAVERARSVDALRARDARHRLALDVAELGTWAWDLASGVGEIDARGAEIVGLPKGGVPNVAEAQLSTIHPDDLPRVQAEAAAGIASGAPFPLDYRVIHPDGSLHHVASRARVERDALGTPLRLVGTNRDVTAERVAADRAVRLQSLTVALAGARTLDDVARVVVDDMVGALGARTGAMSVRSADGLALELVRSEGFTSDAIATLQRQPIDARGPVPHSFRERRPVWVESRDGAEGFDARYPALIPVWSALGVQSGAYVPLVVAGEVVGVISFGYASPHTFTEEERAFLETLGHQAALAVERARLFEAERAARREAESANRAKSEFLAVMSHELRTPLNAIGGYAELMQMGIRGPVTAQQHEDLDRIQASQRHLLGLINEVLNYAKLETGSVRYDVTAVRVRDALLGAEALVAPQARTKGLALTVVECPPELCVRADPEKLRQILVNLLSNAVKFTDAHHGRPGDITLGCATHGAQVAITVRDTGIGIPAERLHDIFEPFVQVRSDLTRTAEGTGLGLAISRDLARGMGGDLVVHSTLGEGSTFTLTLRHANADPAER